MASHSATDVRLAEGVSRDYLLHHRVCPDRFAPDGTLLVAVAPDALLDALDDLAYAYQCPTQPQPRSQGDINRLIERLVTRSERLLEVTSASAPDLGADMRNLIDQPPVIRYVNLLIQDAFDASASDVHLEATRDGLVVRVRVDGVLVPFQEPPAGMHLAVVSRIKLLAELDVAERRRPQDGRIRVRLDRRDLDLRVSTVPTMFGESVVLRLLDRGGRPVELEELGMLPATLRDVVRLTDRPHGLILVTGPTGSGKTTTLYAALQRRRATAEKIITVEDPIEYELPGIVQVPVHRQAGVSFSFALRSILRQDPDVIMVGEMRDTETAELAIQAAMTGHLVFSTLHTNDAIGAIPRLIDLGIPEYLVAATLEGILAQRLVRRLCGECQESYHPPPENIALLTNRPAGPRKLIRGAGCPNCRNTGFKGRIGIFELVQIGENMLDAITRKAAQHRLKELAIAHGMMSLKEDGWTKVQAGLTTVEEVIRVAQH